MVSAGSVRFKRRAGGRGTEVRVRLQYDPPAGKVGAAVAWLFGHEPSQTIREDLRRFKQLMETGEIADHRRPAARQTIDSQLRLSDRGDMKALVWHATNDVRVEHVPDPKILNPRDAIVKITTTAICGSDLHLSTATSRRCRRATSSATSSWARWSRSAQDNTKLKVGDRVVVPFTIACGALLLLRASSCGRCATTRTRTPGWPRSCTATRRRACSATRT